MSGDRHADHVFVLNALINEAVKNRKQELFAAFTDSELTENTYFKNCVNMEFKETSTKLYKICTNKWNSWSELIVIYWNPF